VVGAPQHQDLGDGVERERLERGGERAELGDGGGAAGGDGGERLAVGRRGLHRPIPLP
jgi:hypothetical protein